MVGRYPNKNCMMDKQSIEKIGHMYVSILEQKLKHGGYLVWLWINDIGFPTLKNF